MRYLTFPFSPVGRIDRTRFWAMIGIAVAILWSTEGLVSPDTGAHVPKRSEIDGILFRNGVVVLAAIAASYIVVAAGARRFNDRHKSSWWIFIAFVPALGTLWCLVELGFLPGSPGRNPWGTPPRPSRADIGAVFDSQPVEVVAPASRAACILAVLAAWMAVVLVWLGLPLLFQ